MKFHDLEKLIFYVVYAHTNRARKPKNKVRIWDKKTPYFIHPIWCAMTLLTEEKLPLEIRILGVQVLLFHDIEEDTTAELPNKINKKAKEIIGEMIYKDSSHEIREIWGKSDLAIMFKLYDKVSNLLDSSWMVLERGQEYYEERLKYTLRLSDFVQEKFGTLNIVIMARAVVNNCYKTLGNKGG